MLVLYLYKYRTRTGTGTRVFVLSTCTVRTGRYSVLVLYVVGSLQYSTGKVGDCRLPVHIRNALSVAYRYDTGILILVGYNC